MSNKAKTGGEAFPRASGGGYGENHDGMTLRDYFAAKVLPSLIVDGTALDSIRRASQECKVDGLELTAQMAYAYADAMLAERSK